MKWALVLGLVVLGACSKRATTTADGGTGKVVVKRLLPLAPLVPDDAGDREAAFQVVPFDSVGPPIPEGAVVLQLDGERVLRGGQPFDVAQIGKGAVVLEPVGETYLAQVTETLAKLDDQRADVFVKVPGTNIAYPVVLRDEPAFQAWIDEEAVPGKLRVIQRTDGYELTTNMGKLPGADPKGPSVPLRGGHLDLALLAKGIELIKERFSKAKDVCFVPSYGMELNDVARSLSANFVTASTAHYEEMCLVYPRPHTPDAGK